MPTVRLSLCVMMQKREPRRALTTSPLTVICSFHSGTGSCSTVLIFSASTSNCSDISMDALSEPMVFSFLFFGFLVRDQEHLREHRGCDGDVVDFWNMQSTAIGLKLLWDARPMTMVFCTLK
ncbi:hypothetical protein CJ030_MR6G006602 [Morella rubra]|uniref:Uncharacterized protein n=1 Tax=Morella rubra TaxID=262757 RepID=A0A6A1VL99_9ROSI|nr:hypothetical protein CJ030_MR6G006602 [Morella rubra]